MENMHIDVRAYRVKLSPYSPLPESLWYFSYETSLKLMCYNYDNFLLV